MTNSRAMEFIELTQPISGIRVTRNYPRETKKTLRRSLEPIVAYYVIVDMILLGILIYLCVEEPDFLEFENDIVVFWMTALILYRLIESGMDSILYYAVSKHKYPIGICSYWILYSLIILCLNIAILVIPIYYSKWEEMVGIIVAGLIRLILIVEVTKFARKMKVQEI